MNKNYWDLTDKPHTERKLAILKDYLYPWARIIFSQWIKNQWEPYRVAYFIDCFAGRGKYHKNKVKDSVLGSPLIALECAKFFRKKYENRVELKCIFVEEKPKYVEDLRRFCKPYNKVVNYEIIPGDVNQKIDKVLDKIGSNATLFFIDPWGLKELNKKTVVSIVKKKGANDLLLNYICGVKRVLGSIKKMAQDEKVDYQIIRLVDSVASLHGLDFILKCLNKNDRDILSKWARETFGDTKLKYWSVYRMLHSSRNEAVYYLLFASRSPKAKQIVDYIFSSKDAIKYNGQIKMPFLITKDFDL